MCQVHSIDERTVEQTISMQPTSSTGRHQRATEQMKGPIRAQQKAPFRKQSLGDRKKEAWSLVRNGSDEIQHRDMSSSA
jgi:hypothetical protein